MLPIGFQFFLMPFGRFLSCCGLADGERRELPDYLSIRLQPERCCCPLSPVGDCARAVPCEVVNLGASVAVVDRDLRGAQGVRLCAGSDGLDVGVSEMVMVVGSFSCG